MHDLWQITSGHIAHSSSLNFYKIKGKERSTKFEMSNGNRDLNGSKVQM
jgi:hypothetical protein